MDIQQAECLSRQLNLSQHVYEEAQADVAQDFDIKFACPQRCMALKLTLLKLTIKQENCLMHDLE